MLIRVIFIFILFIPNSIAENLKKCKWDNREGIPCLIVSKTSNTSEYSEGVFNKIIISKDDINNSGAIDVNDVLKNIPGLEIFQSGTKGQTTSLFIRGSESNHTLVMINGIAINDQSVTDGLHDFGQDFIQTIEMIEIYKGSNGANFGPSAVAGAINFVTSIDYKNSYSISGFSGKNNSSKINYTKITDNEWHFNLKSSLTFSETGSSIAGGSEHDGTENFHLNLNLEKWINDNFKFRSTVYSRKTVADYDSSASDEFGYVSDNRMHTIQNELEYVTKNSKKNITLHYHNYDREYENSGFLDEYYSESFIVKSESKNKISNKTSYSYGAEYKYDLGFFENRGSYTASTKGHIRNFGIFGNVGYKFDENLILSFYARSDDHKTTGGNQTYKINFTKYFERFKFNLSHSIGLRNPTLYELYGSDNYGILGNVNLDPEKSETNEFLFSYYVTENLIFNSTTYRSKVYNQIESNSDYSQHENELIDINQEGLENEVFFIRDNQKLSLYNVFSKSRKTNGQAQPRRPDWVYGLNYFGKDLKSPIGLINLNLNFKYTGKYIDWDGLANSRQKSVNNLDLNLSKNFLGNTFSIKLTNLLNEKYEKPATYLQDGRKIMFLFTKNY